MRDRTCTFVPGKKDVVYYEVKCLPTASALPAPTDGDFGTGVTARASEDELFLPDRSRPGLTEVVPLSAVAEIESIANDPVLRVEVDIQPGDAQLLNNGRILHSPGAYEDS